MLSSVGLGNYFRFGYRVVQLLLCVLVRVWVRHTQFVSRSHAKRSIVEEWTRVFFCFGPKTESQRRSGPSAHLCCWTLLLDDMLLALVHQKKKLHTLLLLQQMMSSGLVLGRKEVNVIQVVADFIVLRNAIH